jgi:hypothetical protein
MPDAIRKVLRAVWVHIRYLIAHDTSRIEGAIELGKKPTELGPKSMMISDTTNHASSCVLAREGSGDLFAPYSFQKVLIFYLPDAEVYVVECFHFE